MSKLITTEDGYEIRLGQKNPTCYPCCFEGSVCACRSDLCIKHRDNYIREHGKLPQGRYYTAETQEENLGAMKTKEQIEAHRRTCEHSNTTLLGDGITCCTADLRALPTWQDPGGDGTVYPCGDDCPFMKQFINEDKDEDIETNHSDGRA